jgi:hypothetical protein
MSTDLRSTHWREIRHTLQGKRRIVHEKFGIVGPHTPRELAEYMAWDKCSIRPRCTELLQAGLIEETGERRNGEHVFRFVPLALAESRRRAADEARNPGAQMNLLTT